MEYNQEQQNNIKPEQLDFEFGKDSLEFNKNQLLQRAEKLVEQRNWSKLLDIITHTPDFDPLITQTDLCKEVFEILCAQKLTTEELKTFSGYFNPWTKRATKQEQLHIDYYNLCLDLIHKMSNNPDLAGYLGSLVLDKHIPAAFDEQVGAISDTSDAEMIPEFIYYEAVVDALSKINTPTSFSVIKKTIDQKNQVLSDYYRHFIVDDEDDVSIADQSQERREEFELYKERLKFSQKELGPWRYQYDTREDDYILNESIIYSLIESDLPEACDVLCYFIENQSRRMEFALNRDIVLEAMDNKNKSMITDRMLKLLRNGDEYQKTAASWLLHRLEFGQIRISEEGMQYLERMYDLGECNNPNYFVNRLTGEGDIGIFDENRELIKYFNLGDLTTDEKRVKAAVLDFTYETLFTPGSNESSEDRKKREEILEEFKKNYFSFYNEDFFRDTKVHFNNLSFREQAWFLHFINNVDPERQARALECVKKYGENCLRAFLSFDQSEEMGNVILDIGEKLPKVAAEAIFAKYSEIIDATKDLSEYLQDYFISSQENISSEDVANIENNLFKKAQLLLQNFRDLGLRLISDKTSEKQVMQETLQRLENTKTEILLFASTFQTLFQAAKQEGRSIALKDIKGLSIDTMQATQLRMDADLVNKMKKIIQENYSKAGYPENFIKAVVGSFLEALNYSPFTCFYFLRRNAEVVGFNRFDYIGTYGSQPFTYFGSFNLIPEYQGSKLGEAFLNATTGFEIKQMDPVFADCDPMAPITQKYIELGFVAYELYEYEGVPSFKIFADYNNLTDLKSKTMTKEELINLSQGQAQQPILRIIVRRFAATEQPNFELLKHGYGLTRYFNQNNKVYCVFEVCQPPKLTINAQAKAVVV